MLQQKKRLYNDYVPDNEHTQGSEKSTSIGLMLFFFFFFFDIYSTMSCSMLLAKKAGPFELPSIRSQLAFSWVCFFFFFFYLFMSYLPTVQQKKIGPRTTEWTFFVKRVDKEVGLCTPFPPPPPLPSAPLPIGGEK